MGHKPFAFLSPSSWPVTQLEPSQIRLIVYQDCERRGRNVLFDSSAKKRGTEETPVTVSADCGRAPLRILWLSGLLLLHNTIANRISCPYFSF